MKDVVDSTLNCCFVTDCSVSRARLTIFLRPGTTTASRFPPSPPSKSNLSFYFPHKQCQGSGTTGIPPPNRIAPSQGTVVQQQKSNALPQRFAVRRKQCFFGLSLQNKIHRKSSAFHLPLSVLRQNVAPLGLVWLCSLGLRVHKNTRIQ